MSDIVKKLEHLNCMYKRTMAEVKELTIEAEKSLNFMSSDLLLSRFDELLQHILMCVAITHGEYSESDHKIIKGLALKGDLVKGYNDHSKQIGENVVIGWDALYNVMANLEPMHKAELQASISSCVFDRTELLVKAIAPISCLHHKNYLFEITRRIRWTIVAFINATTPNIREDKLAKAKMGYDVLERLFVEGWLFECRQFTEMFLKNDTEGLRIAEDDHKRLSELDELETGEEYL